MISTLEEAVERALAAERERNEYHENNELLRERAQKAEAVVEAAREFCGPTYSQGSLARLKAALTAYEESS